MQRGKIANSLLLVCCSHRCVEVHYGEISAVKVVFALMSDTSAMTNSVMLMHLPDFGTQFSD